MDRKNNETQEHTVSKSELIERLVVMPICAGCATRSYLTFVTPSRPEKCCICGATVNRVTYTCYLDDVLNIVHAHAMDCGCSALIARDLQP